MIPDADRPYELVSAFTSAVPSGSYLAISHPASDVDPESAAAAAGQCDSMLATTQTNRTREQVIRFSDGLRLPEPGVVRLSRWRPGPGNTDQGTEISGWGGLAKKP